LPKAKGNGKEKQKAVPIIAATTRDVAESPESEEGEDEVGAEDVDEDEIESLLKDKGASTKRSVSCIPAL